MLSQLQTFKDYIRKYALFDFSDTILLTVSGGKDSVAMAHLFHQAGCKFAVAHCNFHLRGQESVRDETFVKDLAEKLDVPFHLANFDTVAYADEHKISIQMAARELRYNFFDKICAQFGYDKIAVAQHQNDAMETVILNLIRGTGIAGLHGIKNIRKNIVRPLMCFTREDIDRIVDENGFSFVEDSSNSSDKYARNKIRLNIVPEMKEINPSLEDTFQKNIAYFSELEDFLRAEIDRYREKLLVRSGDSFTIKIEDIQKLSSPRFILSELLIPFGFNTTSVNDILECCQKSASGRFFYSEEYRIITDRELIILEKKQPSEHLNAVLINQQSVSVTYGNVTLLQSTASDFPENLQEKNFCHVDTNKLIYPLQLRKWELGDRFIPFGMIGFKKISDLLINLKLPINQKEHVLLLVNGNGAVIWVCGYRTDNRFKIGDESKKITTFELKK